MSKFNEASQRDTVLFIGSYFESQRSALLKLSENMGRRVFALVLVDDKHKKTASVAKDPFATVIYASVKSEAKLAKVLKPFEERLLAATARGEANMPLFKKVIPHVPYIQTPTGESLDWSTQKIVMRRLLSAYDKKINPKYAVIHDASQETVEMIESKVGYPLVVKPSGLAASLLVSICYHREELEDTLKKSIRKISAIHKKKGGRGEPTLLVEQFMEGSMYSIDAYVNARGRVYFCPMVHIATGRSVGFDDFFGYKQMTPVKLKPHRVKKAQETAASAIRALGLRSTTAHVELMRTEYGWKIIELGPRIGGYRNKLYKKSYGINHSLNDIRVRIPLKPNIPKKVKGYTIAMKLYGKKEGNLKRITGRQMVSKLESFDSMNVKKKIGERCTFARNGGDAVMEVFLFNKERSKLLADVRRLETGLKIEVGK